MARLTFAVAGLAFMGVVCAQSGRSYSAGHAWWSAGDGGVLPWEEAYDDPEGLVSVFNKNGAVHTAGHPFFERLGANGRACVTCHQPSNAMSLSTTAIGERWNETQGKDPLFASIDGANCPDLPAEAIGSHSLLLDRGLFRIFLPWPAKTSEFTIEVVRDPTGCNKGRESISVYRRPRMAANLEFVSGRLMADGREPTLRAQATTAALIHEQAETPPTAAQLRAIIEFETQIYTAQSADIRGGRLDEKDSPLAKTGPVTASFEIWRKPDGAADLGLQREFRASVARGSDLFFKRTFRIRDASGACATCHTGETRWIDIGTTTSADAKGWPGLPLFRISCKDTAPPHPALGRVFYIQDPGRGLISGKCADVGAVASQQLRGLAARAPYFANGSAATLREVVEFHDRRFQIGFTEQEKQDLVNFLTVL